MKQQFLLLEDVDGLGRSGDIVTAKAGFVRNFLLPQQKVVIADKRTLKMQIRLKEEREKKAIADRKGAKELAAKLADFVITKEVKVDPEGNMYGSVSPLNIITEMKEKGFPIERKHILFPQPIKSIGSHSIVLKLEEDVSATFTLEIVPEGGVDAPPLPEAETVE